MRLTLALVLTLLSSVANAAGGVPDQANLAVYSAAGRSGLVVDATWSAAQVVTAGIGGTLVRVELGVVRRLDTTLPLSVDIVKTIGPVPDFSAAGRLATRTVTPAAIPQSVPLAQGTFFTTSVDVSADNLFFNPDERFAIVLRSDAPQNQGYAWWSNLNNLNTYTRGAGYSLNLASNQTVNQFTDLHFRTFVAVPEPATMALVAASLSALALVRRGRRRRSHAGNRARKISADQSPKPDIAMNTPRQLTAPARLTFLLLLLLAFPSAASAAEPSAAASHSFHSLPEEPRPIRIAIYTGPGSQDSGIRDVERGVKLLPGARLERLPAAAFAQRDLAEFDVVVFSAGGASTQAKDIGEAGRKNVRRFVRRGGAYLGICAGAYLACAEFDWGLKLIAAETISDKWQRGTGDVHMQLTPDGRRAFGSADAQLAVAYENGPVIGPLEVEGIPPYRTLAAFTTELAENDSPPGIMTGSPAIVEGRLGKGRVMIFSPHPERTPGLEQLIPLAITRLTAAEETSSSE